MTRFDKLLEYREECRAAERLLRYRLGDEAWDIPSKWTLADEISLQEAFERAKVKEGSLTNGC